jgi:S-DNA-T family DNA segregation ATPase FtsK/SpoIIIE
MATSKGVAARRSHGVDSTALLIKRIAWVVLAMLWVGVALSLASFNSADWPSHTVGIHNNPTANWCGKWGAIVAYNAWHVFGLGAWVLLLILGVALGVTMTGRRIGQPMLRCFGAILAGVAITALHALVAPNLGPLAGSSAGLVGVLIVGELVPRFSAVGTLLIVLAGFGIGLVVAFDRFVVTVPRAIFRWLRGMWRKSAIAAKGKDASKAKGRAAAAEDDEPRGVGGKRVLGLMFAAMAWPARAMLKRRAKARETASVVLAPQSVAENEATESQAARRKRGAAERAAARDVAAETEAAAALDAITPIEPRKKLSAAELKAKIAKLPVRMGGAAQTSARDEDIPREATFEGYKFPPIDLLEDPESNFSERMEKFVRNQAQVLEETLHTFGIDGSVEGIESGPVVTEYSVQLAPGTKVAKVSAVSSDLARALRAPNIRIVPNTAGKTTVGIEVPNLQKERVRLKELMAGGQAQGMNLPMFLGKDAAGEPLVADLTKMPHMLIAGTTGSGKSVCINTIIMSWLYTKHPNELRLVLIDPKMVELSQFQEIPHLMCPVVTEMSRAAAILEWAVGRMEERYELLNDAGVRDIAAYNVLGEDELKDRLEPASDEEWARVPKRLPFLVFIIDELADLIITNKEVEHSIVRIAQKARAVGIHLIVATQRPQANVVTGLIKSNMPCRASFKVASGMDSRIVLDHKGAELLLGQGDMLFLAPHTSELRRAQGTLVTDTEIRKVTRYLRDVAKPTFERSLVRIPAGGDAIDAMGGPPTEERDPMFDEAVRIMIESGRGSVSLLQRRLSIGYSRASRLVDQMALAGILGDHKGSVAREVMITLEEWEQMRQLEEQDSEHAEDEEHAASSA